jgi:hypothetical protein
MVLAHQSLTNLNAQELREMVTELMAQAGENAKTIASKDREILYRQTKIDQLTHEMQDGGSQTLEVRPQPRAGLEALPPMRHAATARKRCSAVVTALT